MMAQSPASATLQSTQHNPQRLQWVGLSILIVMGMAIRLLAIHNTNLANTFGVPLVDDSFYYFSLGRNLAAGLGPRVDALHLTTGFQPLWGFLVAIPYLFLSHTNVNPIAGVQAMGIGVSILTALVIFAFARRVSASVVVGLIVSGLWFLAPETIRQSVNGMETSLASLTSIAAFYALYLVYKQRSLDYVLLAGFVCGISFLARVDTLLIAAVAGLMMIVAPPLPGNWRSKLQTLVLFGAAAVVPILMWGVFTLSLGKPLLPESGQAVRTLAVLDGTPRPIPLDVNAILLHDPGAGAFIAEKVISFIGEFARQVYPLDIYAILPIKMDTDAHIFVATTIGTFMLAVIGLLVVRDKILRRLLIVWCLYALSMVIAYSFYVLAYWFFRRYTLPLSDTFGVLFSIAILSALIKVRLPRRRNIAVAGMTIFVLLSGAAVISLLTNAIEYRWIVGGPKEVPDDGYYDVVKWLAANVPPNTRVGAFQSGVIGYYSVQPVVNLDGKVNHAAYEAMIQGTMWQYICATNIGYVADIPPYIQLFLSDRSRNWHDSNLEHVYDVNPNVPSPMAIYRVHCSDVLRF